ncbi:uncharacterized protein LOC130933743 [Arachis stenosperma]|uniref:uncharacterized protein LOC130933743 n=1 Tax=Arachis stenosperma TaxID=217475 RepID=UPI0025AC457B|nr:uncharacterized protein LOC130933743 [Arachis stenosperma]
MIELYVEFEQQSGMGTVGDEVNVDELEDIYWEEDNNDSKDEFEANYEVDDENDDKDLVGNPAGQNEANAIVSQHPFGVPSFMWTLDLEAMHVPEFPEYVNMGEGNVAAEDGEFSVGMKFDSRELMMSAIKSYTISRGIDYTVYETEPQTFYAKCKGYGAGCDWLIRASLIRKKACWEIRRYNVPPPPGDQGPAAPQDPTSRTWQLRSYQKISSEIDINVSDAIRLLVEADYLIKVKSVIAEVQGRFNYTVSYRKAWLTKQKAVAKVFGDWEVSYQTLSIWLKSMTLKIPRSHVQIKTLPVYRESEEVQGVRVLHRIFWSFYLCIIAFRHCKPLVQVDGTHLYRKYKGALLVAVAQDGNKNIVPIAFAIVEGETTDACEFFLTNLRRYVVTIDSVGIISDRHTSIDAVITRSNGISTRCYGSIHSKFVASAYDEMIGVERWVLAFDGGHRWGHVTTNLVECINSVLKGACNLPVTVLVRSTFYRLYELFTRKSTEAHERLRNGFTNSEFATKRVEESFRRAENIVVNRFDRRNEMFEVREIKDGTIYTVNLVQQHCDCGHFQVERPPCRHVLTCCATTKKMI